MKILSSPFSSFCKLDQVKMDTVQESKKLVKYESSKEYLETVQYIPFSNTHIITHKGNFKKGFFLKDIAREIIELFGESFISAVAEIPLFILVITWILLFLVLMLISLIIGRDAFLLVLFFFLGVLAKDLKPQFSYMAEYYKNMKCNNCGKEFICLETEKPDIKEISTSEDFRILATRYWKCKSCGYINVRMNYEFATKKGKPMKLSSLAKIACKRCGKTAAYIEYKKPDEIISKSASFIDTMRRSYYRCKFCEFEYIDTVELREYLSD